MGNIIPKMGNEPAISEGLGAALFPRVRLRVLAVLFGDPERKFSISEIIRLARSGNGAVARELERLLAAALITVADKRYQANRESPIFAELRGIVVKTAGLVEPLRQALKPLESKIDLAFVYGSVAKGRDTAGSDIDLMIVSDGLAYGDVFKAAQKAEKNLHRVVNPTLLTASEWNRKRKDKGSFISKIAQQPRVFVFGSDHGSERT
jgi:predicted nucleotidyltransferase